MVEPGTILQKTVLIITTILLLFSAGCATVGRDFSSDQVSRIQLHETTQGQIRSMFGSPWRIGIEDGQRTWTYGRYRYSLFQEASTKDLVIRFDQKGTVASYTFNTTDHKE